MMRNIGSSIVFLLLVSAGICFAPTPVFAQIVVDFDDSPAPCNFNEAYPGFDYQEDGVEFLANGVILDECSGLAFAGSSSPNVFAFDDSQNNLAGHPASGDLLFYSTDLAFYRAQIDVAGSPGQVVTLSCCDTGMWCVPVEDTVVLGDQPATLDAWSNKWSSSCSLSYSGNALVLDNLRLGNQAPPKPVPIETPLSLTLLVGFIGLAGALILRKVMRTA
jgi:hypothetical protein